MFFFRGWNDRGGLVLDILGSVLGICGCFFLGFVVIVIDGFDEIGNIFGLIIR